MRLFLYSLALCIALLLFCLLLFSYSPPVIERTSFKGVYLGYVQHHNLGDDLLLDVFNFLLAARLAHYNTQHHTNYAISMDVQSKYPRLPLFSWKDDRFDFVVLGGGSLFANPYLSSLPSTNFFLAQYLGLWRAPPLLVFGSGWDDNVSQGQLSLPEVRSILSASSHHNPLSSNISAADLLIARPAFNASLPLLHPPHERNAFWAVANALGGTRGPASSAILARYCPQCALPSVGDAGLLYPSVVKVNGTLPDKIRAFVTENQGRYAVISPGVQMRSHGSPDMTEVVGFFTDVALHIAETLHLKILFYHVNQGDFAAMEHTYQRVRAASTLPDSTFIRMNRIPSAPEVGLILCHATLSVNYKLHASVLSAAYGVPFLALGYRFKVYEFAAWVGQDAAVISTADLDTERAKAVVDRLFKERERIKEDLLSVVEVTRQTHERIMDEFVERILEPPSSPLLEFIGWKGTS